MKDNCLNCRLLESPKLTSVRGLMQSKCRSFIREYMHADQTDLSGGGQLTSSHDQVQLSGMESLGSICNLACMDNAMHAAAMQST